MLTGHLYTETTLRTQTDAMGEAMRSLAVPEATDRICDIILELCK